MIKGDMQAVHLEDLTPHYVETLRRRRANFVANATALGALGYGEHFRRLWTLYLAYSEAGFAERRICEVQLLLTKPSVGSPRRAYPERSGHSQQGDLWLIDSLLDGVHETYVPSASTSNQP
jgi:Mycolic acid cyclopropane synthetase